MFRVDGCSFHEHCITLVCGSMELTGSVWEQVWKDSLRVRCCVVTCTNEEGTHAESDVLRAPSRVRLHVLVRRHDGLVEVRYRWTRKRGGARSSGCSWTPKSSHSQTRTQWTR